MLPPRRPSMPTPDLEDQLLEDPPMDMVPARNAKEVSSITDELFQRMQMASPEEKAAIAELLARVNAEADMTKPGADPTMTEPFLEALMRLPPEAREEYMQMAGGLPSLMPGDEMPMEGDRYEPPSSGMPNQMPQPLPENMPGGQADQIPAYMARQQDIPQTAPRGGVDLMALLGGGNMPQQPMNMGSGQQFLGGLMG